MGGGLFLFFLWLMFQDPFKSIKVSFMVFSDSDVVTDVN